MSDRVNHDKLRQTAEDICRRYQPKPELLKFLKPDMPAMEFLDWILVEPAREIEAVEFLAYGLPRRLAIWWGCLCTEMVQGPTLPPDEQAALKAAVEWVLDPSEKHRKAASLPAEKAGPGTAAGNLALAAFSSFGSLLPPDLPVVEPPESLSATYVHAAVHLAASKADPPKDIPQAYRQCIALGIGLGMGKHVWHRRPVVAMSSLGGTP